MTYALEYGRPVFSWASWVNAELERRDHFIHFEDDKNFEVLGTWIAEIRQTWITELVKERNLNG